MTQTTQNSIERRLIYRAPLEKVWKAISTPEGFAGWFSTKVQGVELVWPSGNSNEILLSVIDPETHFAYQWHPGAYAKMSDFPLSELTTVSIILRAVDGGTEIHLVESGFENIPDERRLKVIGMNTEGWDEELENIRKYVEA
jgi:uncharacterized protein YndB with AHSA1/START domain